MVTDSLVLVLAVLFMLAGLVGIFIPMIPGIPLILGGLLWLMVGMKALR